MGADVNPEMMVKFVAGECSPGEVAEVRAWLRSDPSAAAQLRSLRMVWDRVSEAERPTFDVDGGWERLAYLSGIEGRAPAQVSETANAGLQGAPPWDRRRVPNVARRALPIAAVIVLLLGLGIVAEGIWRVPAGATVVAAREITTEPGQRTHVRFDDGSEVILGPGSRLRAPETLRGSRREVFLDGEAFFDIRTDPSRPFRVRTAGAVAEVLGTEFNVRAYPDLDTVRVVVVSGRVNVSAASEAGSGGMVERGQAGRVVRGEAGVVVEDLMDLDRHLAWREARLVFDQSTLGEVAAELERWFGVRMVFERPELASRRLTAAFQRETLSQILEVVSVVLAVEFESRDEVVVVREAS